LPDHTDVQSQLNRTCIPCLSSRTALSRSKSVNTGKENGNFLAPFGAHVATPFVSFGFRQYIVPALRPLSDVFIFFRAVFFVAVPFHFLLPAIYSAVKERAINQRLGFSFSSFSTQSYVYTFSGGFE
jgi:hypothetical protein